MEKISLKINATSIQIAEMQMLKEVSKDSDKADRTGGILGKYIISNFGAEISKAIFDSIPPEGFDDIIDSREDDDGFFSSVIEKADVFSEEMVSIFPTFHPDLTEQETKRIREIVQAYSYIGFRRGYFQGHADAKQQDNE